MPATASTLDFNRELIFGEVGALLAANPVASLVARFTSSPGVISGAAVAGTLAGGGLFWLGARIYDQCRDRDLDHRALAADIAYFTPAALVFGFAVYDPAIFLTSRHLLRGGDRVFPAVLLAQAVAFVLFLGCMNLYRLLLLRLVGRRL
jgi:hypothetical protein